MKDVLVSIVLPVYNGEQFIERSIKSVLKQTHSKIELIVVNDGSKDKTEDIVLGMKKKDSRIKYYRIPNSGVSSARNRGLENVTGKYVGFVDADDYIDSEMIEILLSKAINYNCDIVSCLYEKRYIDKSVKEQVVLESGYYNKKQLEEFVYQNFFNNNHVPLNIVTKLYNNDLIKKNSLKFDEELKFGEDLLFTRRFLLYSKSFYFIGNLNLYNYVYNEDSVTSKYHPNKWLELKRSIFARRELIDDYPEYKLEKQYYISIFNSSINALLNISKNKNDNRKMKMEELSQIIEDPLVEISVENIELTELNLKKKILAYLLKWKRTKLIYILLEMHNNISKNI